MLYAYIKLYTLAQAACLIIAWYSLRRVNDRAWAWNRYYLAIALLLELAGIGYTQWVYHVLPQGWPSTNHWIYNIQLLVMAAFVSWFFFGRIRVLKLVSKHWMYGWFIIFGAVYTMDICIHNGINRFFVNAFFCLQIGILVGSLYYCWLLLRQPIHRGLMTYPDFWWVFGTAYFFFGMTVYHAFFERLLTNNMPVWGMEVSVLIIKGLNLVFYGSWSYAFMLCRHKN